MEAWHKHVRYASVRVHSAVTLHEKPLRFVHRGRRLGRAESILAALLRAESQNLEEPITTRKSRVKSNLDRSDRRWIFALLKRSVFELPPGLVADWNSPPSSVPEQSYEY